MSDECRMPKTCSVCQAPRRRHTERWQRNSGRRLLSLEGSARCVCAKELDTPYVLSRWNYAVVVDSLSCARSTISLNSRCLAIVSIRNQ